MATGASGASGAAESSMAGSVTSGGEGGTAGVPIGGSSGAPSGGAAGVANDGNAGSNTSGGSATAGGCSVRKLRLQSAATSASRHRDQHRNTWHLKSHQLPNSGLKPLERLSVAGRACRSLSTR